MKQPEFSPRQSDSPLSFAALQLNTGLMLHEIRCLVDRLEFVGAEKVAKALVRLVESGCPPSNPLLRRALVELSETAKLVQDYDLADVAITKAMQLAALYGRVDDGDCALNKLRQRRADLMIFLGRTEEALALWALVFDEGGCDKTQRAAGCIGMAQAHMAAGRIQEYGTFMRMAYQEAKDVPRQSAEALGGVLVDGGNREARAGRFEASAGLLQSALDILRESSDQSWRNLADFEMHIAEQLERAGLFQRADTKRTRVLHEVVKMLSERDEYAMETRQTLALGMVGHARGNFEWAEQMLVDNVTYAQESQDPTQIAKALVALAEAHRVRGMYMEAVQDMSGAYQCLCEKVDPYVRIKVLRDFGDLLSECGAGDRAESIYRKAVQEAKCLAGPSGITAEVAALSSLARSIATEKPGEAQEVMQRCRDLLDELPPSYEPISRMDLNLISFSFNEEEVQPDTIVTSISQRLQELRQSSGEAYAVERASLMYRRGQALLRSGDIEGARAEFEAIKDLLEKRAATQTTLFAMVLTRLVDTLSPDDGRVREYRERAEAIIEQAVQASEAWGGGGEENSDNQ
jgi:tetratricopeptide (TPR) repeat protein